MKLWDISGDGKFWKIRLDIGDLGGHLDFTRRARAGTLSKSGSGGYCWCGCCWCLTSWISNQVVMKFDVVVSTSEVWLGPYR